MEYLERVGLNIKRARLRADMSQDELATKIGYKGKASISLIESGKADIPQKKLVAISQVLNTPIAELLKDAPDAETYANITQSEQDLLDAFRKADRNTQLLILFALKLQEGEDGKI